MVQCTITQMSDRALVSYIKESGVEEPNRNQAEYILYKRYENFLHKHWHSLSKQLYSSGGTLQGLRDDFYSETYFVFKRALKAVDLQKVRDDNWKFLGYFGFYLSNYRNKYAEKVLKRLSKERPNDILDDDYDLHLTDILEEGVHVSAESEAMISDEQKRVDAGLHHCKTRVWSSEQVAIFNLRAQNKSIKVISKELSMSPWKCTKLLNQMKGELSIAIERAGRKNRPY